MTAKDDKNDEKPVMIVQKITPQIIGAMNKELDRLHKTLTSPNLDIEDKHWVKDRIKEIHSVMFNPTFSLRKQD